MPSALGYKSRLGMSVADPVTAMFEFLSETLTTAQALEDTSGTRGTLDDPDNRVREASRSVAGSIEMNPTPLELDLLIPLITGATKVSDVAAMVPTDPLPAFTIAIDRDVKVFKYTGCKIGKAEFSAQANGPLKLALDIVGVDSTKNNAGTFPALTPKADTPFMFYDCVLTIGGTTYPINNFKMTYTNALGLYFANSVTPTRINQEGRIVEWSLELPAGDAEAIWGTSALSAVAVQAQFTNGNTFLRLRSELVRAPKEDFSIGTVQGEVPMMWNGISRINATFPSPIYITSDSSP